MTRPGQFHNVRWSGSATGFAVVSMKTGDTVDHPILGKLRVQVDGVYQLTERGLIWLRPADNEGEDA